MTIMMTPEQNSYLREVRESQKVFSALVIAMEKSHKAVITAIEERQRDEERRVEALVRDLKQEIQALRKEFDESDPQIHLSGDEGSDTKEADLVSTNDDVLNLSQTLNVTSLDLCLCLCVFAYVI